MIGSIELDPVRLFFVLSGSFLLGSVAVLAARGAAQRLILTGLLFGLTFYNGVGAADRRVPVEFIGYYFAVFFALAMGFHIGRPLFLGVAQGVGERTRTSVGSTTGSGVWWGVITLYLLFVLLQLVWPEFRLHRLLAPPIPDSFAALLRRVTVERDAFSAVLGYGRVLLTPLYFVALYRFRERLPVLVALLLFPLYAQYVAEAYISRGEVATTLCIVLLAMWFWYPRHRIKMVVSVLTIGPAFLYGSYLYARVRVGDVLQTVAFGDALSAIAAIEFSFPGSVGTPLLESGARVDLGGYFTWITTLPVPKVLTGTIEGARINYEISEIVLGLPVGAPGWYVVLPGLVAESVYIYGSYFLWLHGVTLGLFAAFVTRLVERVPQFWLLHCYITMQFAYVLNRGGVSALMPTIVNEFLLLYIFILYATLRPRRNALVPHEDTLRAATVGAPA